ncbi:MAG: hypothetical protein GY703_09375 [Gammaproteobacteria bacterium]|nr:hypothetical protein [Gammaproteobacteria bacterium]
MKKLSSTGCKMLSQNWLGKTVMPVVILAGVCSVAQVYAADEETGSSSAAGSMVQINEMQGSLAKAEAALEQTQAMLAESEQKLSILGAQRDDLNKKLTTEQAVRSEAEQALEAASAEIQKQGREVEQARSQLIQKDQQIATLSSERDQVAGTLTEAREGAMKLEDQLKSASAGQQDLAATLDQTRAQLKMAIAERNQMGEQLTESQAQVATLRESVETLESSSSGMRKEIDTLQAMLPQSLGGDASLQSLQEPAGQLAAELVDISRALRRAPNDPELIGKRDAVAKQLSRQQLLIASATGADGVYQLQANDTLGIVARRVYGNAGQWPEIYEANSHILKNPDLVVPEMTLITP